MGLSSFLQIQSLGKSQRIVITLMRSEQPRSSLRHHRTTGGQHPHAKLHPLPLASSKNHLKSAETNLRPKLQLIAITDCRRVQNADSGPKTQRISHEKAHFCLAGSRRESLIAKKLQKHSVFLFSQWVDRRNGAKSPERRKSLQPQESPVRFDDMHSGGCPRRPIVPHADSHCSHR